MKAEKEIVVYRRSTYCPYQRKAERVFQQFNIPHREIMIDRDEEAMKRVIAWTGFQSVPTIVIARPGENLPYEEPAPLEPGQSPRGVDRGTMITEPLKGELIRWLQKHGFIEE